MSDESELSTRAAMFHENQIKPAAASDSALNDLLRVFGVWIVGYSPRIPEEPPIAIFVHEEQAEEWARNNYFGQWVLKQIEMPFIQFCTDYEREKAEIEGKKLAEFFKQLPTATDT